MHAAINSIPLPGSAGGNLAQVQSRAGQMLSSLARDAESYRLQKEAAKLARKRQKRKPMSNQECIARLYETGHWPTPAQRAGYR